MSSIRDWRAVAMRLRGVVGSGSGVAVRVESSEGVSDYEGRSNMQGECKNVVVALLRALIADL
jgi:hypothetical protein